MTEPVRHAYPIERCTECGHATVLMVSETDLDLAGRERVALWRQVIEHKRRDCEAFQALAREEWPTLF